MRYSFSLLVPPDTQEASPAEAVVKLSAGTVSQCLIRFRDGCHHRVFVTIRDALFQVVPSSGTDPLYGDGEVLAISLDYPLQAAPYELILAAWSPGTRYTHELSFDFDLVEDEAKKKDEFLAMLEGLDGDA